MALEQEFQYFLDHQDELVAKYRDKFVVIKGQDVVGAWGSEVEAITEASKLHELGSFLVQECTPGTDSYTRTFHSRVAFA